MRKQQNIAIEWNESHFVGLGFIFCVAWMSYRFKPWLDEHVTKLRDEHWPTNKEACNESSQSYRDLSSAQNPRWSSCPKCPGRSSPRHRWLVLGRWDGASCRVCVCVSAGPGWAEIEVFNRTYEVFSV